MKKIKTIFIGSTEEFSVPILESVLEKPELDVVAVITQPDKRGGRGRGKLIQSPVKKYLLEQKYSEEDILQPKKIKKISDEVLKKYKPELILVAAYGQMIPKDMLDFPKYGCLNFHGSILPELRGAVPVHMAILQGRKRTGLTLQKMVEKLDAGDIISTREVDIAFDDTSESLMRKLADLGKEIVFQDLYKWVEGDIVGVKQDERGVTLCSQEDIAKRNAEILFDTEVELAERMVRALFPWPVAWITLENGRKLRIFKSHILDNKENKEGKLFLSKEGKELVLNLKDGRLVLDEVQLEGKSRGAGKSYAGALVG